MLGDGILETTTTTGTGDLTTSAVTGRPRITDYLTANATEASADHFYYSILTQDNPPQILETGIGYMSATGTLKRIVPLTTYASGTLTKNSTSVSAVSLASGTKNVIVTAMHSSGHGLAIPGIDTATASITPVRYHYSEHTPYTSSGGGLTVTTNRLYVQPIKVNTARVIDALVFRCTGGSAAGNARIGLYSVNRDGTPGRKIAGSTADVAISAGNFVAVTTGLPLLLPPGWYYLAFVADAGVTITTLTGSLALPNPMGYDGSAGLAAVMMGYLANGSTALPDPFGTITTKLSGPSGNLPLSLMMRSAA